MAGTTISDTDRTDLLSLQGDPDGTPVFSPDPQNGWLENSSDMAWGIIRNIPFVIIGAIVCLLFFQKRTADRLFRFVWVYILLSFLFYIPVAVGAGAVPILGMLMLPKTVCYILLITVFLRAVPKGRG